MGFLSAEQALKVRLRGSKLVRVDALDDDVRIVKLSAHAQLEAKKMGKRLQTESAAESATAEEDGWRELFLFMLEHGVADKSGQLHGPEGARELFALIGLQEVARLVNEVKDVNGLRPGEAPAPAPKTELAPMAKEKPEALPSSS